MWAGFQTEIAHFFVFCGLFLIQVCGCWLEEARLLIVSVPSCLIFFKIWVFFELWNCYNSIKLIDKLTR